MVGPPPTPPAGCPAVCSGLPRVWRHRPFPLIHKQWYTLHLPLTASAHFLNIHSTFRNKTQIWRDWLKAKRIQQIQQTFFFLRNKKKEGLWSLSIHLLTAFSLARSQEGCWSLAAAFGRKGTPLDQSPDQRRALSEHVGTLLKDTSAVLWSPESLLLYKHTFSNLCLQPGLEPRTQEQFCISFSIQKIYGNENKTSIRLLPF